MKDAASLVGALNQVAGFVISVAAVDGTASQRVLFAAGCWCAVLDGTLAFQTTHGVVGVGEGMAQRVGAFERQSVHCEFVGGFGTESVDVGGQSVEAVVLPSPQPSPTREGVDVGMEKSSSNTSLIYINPNKSLNYLIPSTLPKNKEKAKKSFPIFFLLNFLTP